jgi:hypothetical protein
MGAVMPHNDYLHLMVGIEGDGAVKKYVSVDSTDVLMCVCISVICLVLAGMSLVIYVPDWG